MTASMEEKLQAVQAHSDERQAKRRKAYIAELCSPTQKQAEWWEENKNRVVHRIAGVEFTLDELTELLFQEGFEFTTGGLTPVRCFGIDISDLEEKGAGGNAGYAYDDHMRKAGVLTTTMGTFADLSIAVAPPAVLRTIWGRLENYDEWTADLLREALTIVMGVRGISPVEQAA